MCESSIPKIGSKWWSAKMIPTTDGIPNAQFHRSQNNLFPFPSELRWPEMRIILGRDCVNSSQPERRKAR
jgi:hypothetical protein